MRWIFLMVLLLGLTRPAAAAVYAEEYTELNLHMRYPVVSLQNQEMMDKINGYLWPMIENFQVGYERGAFFRGELRYHVYFEDDTFLALAIEENRYMPGANLPETKVTAMVFEKCSGERIPIEYFTHAKRADVEGEAFNGQLYNEENQKIRVRSGAGIHRLPRDYFITEDGAVCVVFQPYELGEARDGATYVRLSPEMLEYFERKYSHLNGE